ncbi:hypothetical protein K431DRAFT_221414 [Polychaeton citri CBS 116435]|uniref:Alpha-1,3-mannosyltransferase n=1 Tax=Polychaeton citri CBS 116435 TaxID=1314669 RepID=A0A9P4URM6_9PEZI|nr:hypothetical protein K431DRAFT_221414 [Polychaeton citri CBS 116435]
MPPALHPRSRQTSTLFTTTLAISFLVVSLPHLLPCPVDRRQLADSIQMGPDGKPLRRRRRRIDEKVEEGQVDEQRTNDGAISENIGGAGRECPVPKPGGIIGQVFGFSQGENPTKPEVVVQSLPKHGVDGKKS